MDASARQIKAQWLLAGVAGTSEDVEDVLKVLTGTGKLTCCIFYLSLLNILLYFVGMVGNERTF